MDLKHSIKLAIKSSAAPCSLDVVLKNGNILLRAFQVVEFDEKSEILKGLTQQEAYSFLREERPPVYCVLPVSEIKEATICKSASLRTYTNA